MQKWKKLVAGLFVGLAMAMPGAGQAAEPAPLMLKTYNPGAESLFPVSSTLVVGKTESVLIDAQFQRNDAEAVLAMIRKSVVPLKTIYISHGDPDFYFGLDVITDAYPRAKVLASPATIDHIRKTLDKKISYWGPILGKNAPVRTMVPDGLDGDTIKIDGAELKVMGLGGHDPKHTYVWIPSLKTVTGGVPVYQGVHVWMADSKTAAARQNWRKTLNDILALHPSRIIPGHVIGKTAENAEAIRFTRDYIDAFEAEATKAGNSGDLIAAMKSRYPEFSNIGDLTLSAKVVMGEVEWP